MSNIHHDLTEIDLLEQALAQCASEPIHLPGQIQPDGVMLVFGNDLIIRAHSTNIAALFGAQSSPMIGKPIGSFITLADARPVTQLDGLGEWRNTAIVSVVISCSDITINTMAAISHHADQWLIELELKTESADSFIETVFQPIRDAMWQLDALTNTQVYCEKIVQHIRRLSGYDRVMLYRFESNRDGVVIAESKSAEVGSYLRHHFPASDIPPQAIALYEKNLVRVITNVDARQVPLIGQREGLQSVDMTYAVYRSLSPVHIEYLRNMDVAATLVISLIQNGRLWGLIACHHQSDKYVSLRERDMFEFIGKTVSFKLGNLYQESINRKRRQQEQIKNKTAEKGDHLKAPESLLDHLSHDLQALFDASGLVIRFQGAYYSSGETPHPDCLAVLEEKLRMQGNTKACSSDNIAGLFNKEHASDLGLTGGVLLAYAGEFADNYMMCFRKPVTREIHWAGKPEKYLSWIDGKAVLSPRKSFDAWVDVNRDKSSEWDEEDKEFAHVLVTHMLAALKTQQGGLAAPASTSHIERIAMESYGDAVLKIDASGKIEYISPGGADLLGYSAAQLLAQDISIYIGREQTERLWGKVASIRDTGELSALSISVLHPSGHKLWLDIELKCLDVRLGNGILLRLTDVSERGRYQALMEGMHSEQLHLLNRAEDAIVSVDVSGHFNYANAEALALLSLTKKQLLGQFCCDVFREFVTPLSMGSVTVCPFIDAMHQNHVITDTKAVVRLPDTSQMVISYVLNPMHDNEKIIGAIMTFREFRSSSMGQLEDVIMKQSSDAVIITNGQGVILSVNDAFSRITGYRDDEVIGTNPRLLQSGIHTADFYHEMWTCLTANKRWSGEIWNRRKNGEIYPQQSSISVIEGEEGIPQNYVAVFHDISQARMAEDNLFYLTHYDALTELPNRSYLLEQLHVALQNTQNDDGLVAVICLNIDRFKLINDSLGNDIGDELLRNLVRCLSVNLGERDVLGRWTDDGFVLLMKCVVSQPHALARAGELLKLVTEIEDIQGHHISLTASAGVAVYQHDDTSAQTLLTRADTAMHVAKSRGGGRFELFNEAMAKLVQQKLDVGNQFRSAVRNGELELYYQPKIDAEQHLLLGVEALVRWNHPQKGLLLPGKFLRALEELGMETLLGDWVLRRACEQMQAWIESGVAIPHIAVNVSPSQLVDGFVPAVLSLIEDYGLSPEMIELEIVEGALERTDKVIRMLHELRACGIALSVDDFGTGYSSLSHIKEFPVGCFKIDKSFVDGIPGDRKDMAIISTIIALGESIDVDVLAEGVESEAQCQALRELGIRYIQGYYFAKPMPEEKLIDWLRQWSSN